MSRSDTALPALNLVDFYRLKEFEFFHALGPAFDAHCEQYPEASFSPDQQALRAWSRMLIDVPNGGYAQFFYNHHGDQGVAELADLLEALAMTKFVPQLREALAVFHAHASEFDVANPWNGELFGNIKEFAGLDAKFMNSALGCTRALEKWLRGRIAELATGEQGGPIDPAFTGEVQTHYPGGAVKQSLDVKKGKPHGAYREYFDDGVVQKVVFYKSGKVTKDFWPDGSLKRKESRRGDLKVFEFFFPGGQLQKRYVQDRKGFAAEPIQLFHENGQLAEQLGKAGHDRSGPWLKFFSDGSPKLQAEYAKGQRLIVHNAWNDEGVQVVKDGTGVFYDEGVTIDWPYAVFFKHHWQTQSELRDGIENGIEIKYHDHVLWSRDQMQNGVLHGTSTQYWNNGRVRKVTEYKRGKPGKSESFPKFDHPVPVVLLRVQADEELYTAWQHFSVDEYPRVLNLPEIQARLEVPDFLQQIHARNQANALRSDYEDCNNFEDGIAYFLLVDEAGKVSDVVANGSGVYSTNWDTYPPLLSQLRFNPGRIRGRAVKCQVLAYVDHTFAESSSESSKQGAVD